MISLMLRCSICKRTKSVKLNTGQQVPNYEHPLISGICNVKDTIEDSAHWIVQQNGRNLDVYCSVKCAKGARGVHTAVSG